MAGKSERGSETTDARAARVARAIAGTRFELLGWVAETGSTNADLAAEAERGGPEQVLVTDLQTAGRGRRDRVWTAPAESAVLASLSVRDHRRGDSNWTPFWAVASVSLAAAEAVSVRTALRCGLKWPNDLLLDGSKVAGVLAQAAGDAMVVGIGINADWRGGRPDGVPGHATSIDRHLAAGVTIDRESLVVDLITGADRWLSAPLGELRSAWTERCVTVGTQVTVLFEGAADLVGQATGVGADGELIVVDRAGVEHAVHVGDVIHLRRG